MSRPVESAAPSGARDAEWRAQRIAEPLRVAPREVGGGTQVPPGFGQRDQAAFYRLIVDIIERGHPGPEGGEPYVAAVLREEREEAEARARGERYTRRRYGPSLVGGGSIVGTLSRTFRGAEEARGG